MTFHIRLAGKEDVDRIQALMKQSMRLLGQGYYLEKQIESCCQHVCIPDLQLIEDGIGCTSRLCDMEHERLFELAF